MDEFQTEVSSALTRIRNGDRSGASTLFPLVYDRLREQAHWLLSRERVNHTLQATALVNEAYLRLINSSGLELEDEGHLQAIAVHAMRRILVDHARKKTSAKRGGQKPVFSLDENTCSPDGVPVTDLLDLEDALQALAALDERKAQVAELRIFGEMTIARIASTLDVSETTVEREWYFSRAWLETDWESRDLTTGADPSFHTGRPAGGARGMNVDKARFERMGELFGAARQMEGEARARYLRDRCGDDGDLLGELEAMLSADEKETEDHGDGSSLGIDVPLSWVEEAVSESPGPESPPEMIGKYRILEALGMGGQAAVYRGFHPELGREVVIKLASGPWTAGSGDRTRLIEEGRILAGLETPGLGRVYDCDFHEGRPYLVLELIRGKNLSQVLDDGRLDPMDAARIVARIARALEPAHRRGITHRDIKPANIVLDEERNPWLIDFGIAAVRDAWLESELSEPMSGTVEFMAPEQAHLEGSVDGPRSDVFSLGAVLFYLLTGQAPFTGENVKERLERARRADFDRELLHQPGIPGPLAAVCLKAMSAKPEDRQDSALGLADELEEILGMRARGPWVFALLLVLGIGLLIGGLLWLPDRGFVVERAAFEVRGIDATAFETLTHEGVLSVGDDLRLSFQADQDLYLYVLNEDEQGWFDRIFPDDRNLLLRNPLPAGTRHELPGETPWRVQTRGGREHFLLVASPEPIPELDALESGNPLTTRSVETILRGVGLPPEARKPATGASRLDAMIPALESRSEGTRVGGGIWVRKVTFQNP